MLDHMRPYQERVVLAGGALAEIALERDGRYRLRFARAGELLVEYRSDGAKHHRRGPDREHAYEFRSVEQLRYDFERDVEEAQRQG